MPLWIIRGDAPKGSLDSYSSERHPVGALARLVTRPGRADAIEPAFARDTRDGATYFAERVWGVSLRYDLASRHPLVGRSAPDFELVDGRKLGELSVSGKGLWSDFDADAPLQKLAGRWSDRITHVASHAKDRLDWSGVLVRPDGGWPGWPLLQLIMKQRLR